MTSTMPSIAVSDVAVLAAIRAGQEDPKLEYHAILDVEIDDARTGLAAAAPHLIRDWARTVLALYPHVLPGPLAELADGLLPEETT
jgi:hypothetical protein